MIGLSVSSARLASLLELGDGGGVVDVQRWVEESCAAQGIPSRSTTHVCIERHRARFVTQSICTTGTQAVQPGLDASSIRGRDLDLNQFSPTLRTPQ